MSRTDVIIADISAALVDLKVEDRRQRLAIFAKSIESVVNFAIIEHQAEQFRGIHEDLARVAQIQEHSKRAAS